MIFFSKSAMGYMHVDSGKPCQDFSASYHDEVRTIVTACDGHGGDMYVRSDKGSKFASDAIMNVFRNLEYREFYKYSDEVVMDKLKLQILCEWNNMVEDSLKEKKISKWETNSLTDKQKERLNNNNVKAYGTTLQGVMVIKNKLIMVSLGDGGIFLVRDGDISPVFDDDDEDTVANITYSMCQEDAYKYIKMAIIDFKEVDGVLICTDGVVNPYQNLENFSTSFVNPVFTMLYENKTHQVENFIEKLGSSLGIGDDVSLGVIMKDNIKIKKYLVG